MKRLTFTAFVLFNLSLAQAAEFKIDSTPANAEIFVRKKLSDAPIKVGSTPFLGDLDQIKSQYGLPQNFFIELSKEGYKQFNIMLSPIQKSDIDLNVKLDITEDLKLTRRFDDIANNLFEAQRLTRDKNYDGALKELEKAEILEKNLSIISEMRGGIYYLKKDFNSALASYRKAFSLNTKNTEAYSMKVYLESTLGLANE